MMYGEHSRRPSGGGKFLPRVVQVSVERAGQRKPAGTKPLEFAVSIHEEGTALTWCQTVEVTREAEQRVIARTADLHRWSLGLGLTSKTAQRIATDLGRDLQRTFLGRRGAAVLASLEPTAVLFSADETMLNLPWETLRAAGGPIAPDVPFGRVVSSGMVPRARRDPLDENPTVRILVIANPTNDLAATDAELGALAGLRGSHGGPTVEVDTLEGDRATRAGLAAAVKGEDYDIIHFAGHAAFNTADPELSALMLADGPMAASAVERLKWSAPPYIVFNSACESARAAAGRRLVSARGNANGLVAAFLAAGSEAYIGHFWPVDDVSAAKFSENFYGALFAERNVGTAITRAREAADYDFSSESDLTALGAIFFGDAGTAQRRDLAMSPPPDDEPAPRRDLVGA